jgi:murein DD-endopeptidase MepM/ murein hydrolase activator NlpD
MSTYGKRVGKDQMVLNFVNELGDTNPSNELVIGYQNSAAGFIFFEHLLDNYTGGTYLYYDGHPGYDFPGTHPILAAASGDLDFPDKVPAYGAVHFNQMRITHSDGTQTFYLHAVEGSECYAFFGAACASNDKRRKSIEKKSVPVTKGQRIGTAGNTGAASGASTGIHLHFQVVSDGVVVDPFGCHPLLRSAQPAACPIEPLWED